MINKTTNYEDYDEILKGLVDFWLNRTPISEVEYKMFCGQLEQHLRNTLEESQEWVEIDLWTDEPPVHVRGVGLLGKRTTAILNY